MVETYDARSVVVVVNGTVITGFADNSFVSISRNGDNFVPYVGAQGEVARSRNADRSAVLKLTLKHTSPSNTYLADLAKSDDTFSVSVTDGSIGTVSSGVDCWVNKIANREYAKEITSREWEIFIPELDESN